MRIPAATLMRDWRTIGALAACTGAATLAFTLGPAAAPSHAARVDTNTTKYNGIVDSSDGSALTLRAYPVGGTGQNTPALDTTLPTAGQLPSGTEVHISCYLTATTPVVGPQGQGTGGSDPYWDQIDAASTTLPPLPAGDVAVVPDAFIYTNNPVNQTAPPCSGPAKTTGGANHDSSIDQQVTGAKHTILSAQSANTPALSSSGGPQGGCSVGSVPLDALTCGGPVKNIDSVVTYAAQAHVDPRLLLAILYNESGCHVPQIPHSPACEFVRSHLSGALGIANMHPDAFTQAQTQAAGALDGHSWSDLAYNTDLDVQAEAWYVASLDQQLPASWSGSYGQNELLAMMYNGGAANLAPVVQGTQKPGPDAQSYLDQVRGNWDFIDELICRSGAYNCSL